MLLTANAHIAGTNPGTSTSLPQSVLNSYNNNNNNNISMSFNANTNLPFTGMNTNIHNASFSALASHTAAAATNNIINSSNNNNSSDVISSQGQRTNVKERKSTTNSTATVSSMANAIATSSTTTTPSSASQRKSHNKTNVQEPSALSEELQTNIFTEMVQKVKVALATFVDKFISACNENKNSASSTSAIVSLALSAHINRNIAVMLPSLSSLSMFSTASPNFVRMKSKGNLNAGVDYNIGGSNHNLTSLGNTLPINNVANYNNASSVMTNVASTRTGAIAARCLPLALQEL